MDELNFHVPTDLHFGIDHLNRIGQIAAPLGTRALLLADSALDAGTILQPIQRYLEASHIETILFDEIGPGSTSAAIETALGLCRASRPELVVGIGGIRALSYAKCVARLARVREPFDDYFLADHTAEEAKSSLALLSVPTTPRDPFLLTDQALIVDARNRRAAIHPTGKRPDAALFDASFSLALSQKFTVATILDTLLAAVESYFSRRSTFLSETLSLRAVGAVSSILDELSVHPAGRELHLRASQAGLLVALSLTMSTLGVGSALAYAIGGRHSVPKSMVASVMIPHVLELGLRSEPKKVERIGNVLGEEVYGKPLAAFSVQVVDAVRQRMGLLEVPMRLKDLGLDLDELVEPAQGAHRLSIAHFLSEPLSEDDIFALVRRAY